MGIDANGVITWTPQQNQTRAPTFATVITDSNPYDPVNPHLRAAATFTVTVAQVNIILRSGHWLRTVNGRPVARDQRGRSNIHSTLRYALVTRREHGN